MNYSKPNHCTHNRTYIFPKILRSNTNTTLFEPRFPHVESQIFWLMKSTHIRNTQTRFGGFSVGSSCQTCHHTNLPLLGWKLQCAKALNQGISSNPKVCIREWFVVFDLKICETRVGTTAACLTNAPPVQNTLLPLYSAAEKSWPV